MPHAFVPAGRPVDRASARRIVGELEGAYDSAAADGNMEPVRSIVQRLGLLVTSLELLDPQVFQNERHARFPEITRLKLALAVVNEASANSPVLYAAATELQDAALWVFRDEADGVSAGWLG